MPEPVRLSSERWDVLWRAFRGPNPEHEGALTICLDVPHEADGVVFLPAVYVLGDAQDHHPG